jgi:hypothetical protein
MNLFIVFTCQKKKGQAFLLQIISSQNQLY